MFQFPSTLWKIKKIVWQDRSKQQYYGLFQVSDVPLSRYEEQPSTGDKLSKIKRLKLFSIKYARKSNNLNGWIVDLLLIDLLINYSIITSVSTAPLELSPIWRKQVDLQTAFIYLSIERPQSVILACPTTRIISMAHQMNGTVHSVAEWCPTADNYWSTSVVTVLFTIEISINRIHAPTVLSSINSHSLLFCHSTHHILYRITDKIIS